MTDQEREVFEKWWGDYIMRHQHWQTKKRVAEDTWKAALVELRQPTRELHELQPQEGNSQPKELQQQIQP